MQTTSLFDAKTHLSRLVERLVSGEEDEVVISRHGKPVARLTALPRADVRKRIGLAAGRFKVPDDIDAANPRIAKLFGAGRVPR